jgi:hypothetical protein
MAAWNVGDPEFLVLIDIHSEDGIKNGRSARVALRASPTPSIHPVIHPLTRPSVCLSYLSNIHNCTQDLNLLFQFATKVTYTISKPVSTEMLDGRCFPNFAIPQSILAYFPKMKAGLSNHQSACLYMCLSVPSNDF